ncbi:hypothetical protein HF888_00505 [Bermanella marisrubri]|uniref:Uncharacterized protein n=1 Tax=Bermanella marisrubri TaxID=207949 RepID=Q1N3Y9_9GAMM|nr:hypothetical protein [Bermanella marisrubri]EAT13076.1 hypothetical protein RED65_15307 [Oceanobacter sp. RED65] [Bermanella marisrubri]QIZ82808.1 hypothetical protein HF888_00505 [Bermanella marisrubri]
MYSFLLEKDLPLFKSRWIYFPDTSDLQDPYLFHEHVVEAKQEPMSQQQFEAAVRAMYMALDDHMKAIVSEEYYLQQAQKNRGNIEKQLRQQQAKQQTPAAKHNEYYRQACMLRVFGSIYWDALWQYQGYAHKGIAIQWDVQHAFFQSAKAEGGPQLFANVEYEDARPEFPSKENPFPALLRRPEHWAWQQEARLIRPKRTAPKKDHHKHYYKVPKDAVMAVYLGLQAAKSVEESMLKLLQYDLQFRHLKLFRMQPSDRYLRLVAVPLSISSDY